MALKSAGENHPELEQVLAYYQDNPKKLAAAHFLIENTPYHFTNEECFASANGKPYYPDITQFPSADAIQKHCDSLQAKGWTIQRKIHYDAQCLKAEFLIRNIDLAFEAWQKPWAKEVSFDDFCRYILPYRVQNEPLSDLRETLMQRYLPLLDSAKAQNAWEACMVVNAQLKKEIKYQRTGNPLGATLEETDRSGIGTCEALCNYATFVMRAVGIPIAVLRTTWTRMDLGHNWCTVLYKGKFYEFSPGDTQPDSYQHTLATTRYLKPAKVYRMHFDADLSRLPKKDDGYVTQLKNPLYTDVTDEGELPSYSLRIPANREAGNSSGMVYLCAYNYYQWQPIAIGRREGDTCRFDQVAGRNFFIVAEAKDKHELQYVSVPFFTEGDGTFRLLKPDTRHPVSQVFQRVAGENPQILYYWDCEKQGFSRLEYAELTDSTQFYNNVPDNALLWYILDRKALGQRVGMIVDGEYKQTHEL